MNIHIKLTWLSMEKAVCWVELRCCEAYRLKKSQKWWYILTAGKEEGEGRCDTNTHILINVLIFIVINI